MVLENWVCIFKGVKLDQYLTSCTNINSKQMKDLNLRPKTLKLVEKKNRAHIQAIDIGKDFLTGTLVTQEIRPIIEKRS